jgi:hypothetical protein
LIAIIEAMRARSTVGAAPNAATPLRLRDNLAGPEQECRNSLIFFHLREGTVELLDPEGDYFIDVEALQKQVLRSARDVIAGMTPAVG